ncbi:MAG: hypothetical protein DMG13_00610 [Acidobacteria bacterium]|nr:MAG: hypothetical protein DMG13_00610 [Acidobacteriota bacterium]
MGLTLSSRFPLRLKPVVMQMLQKLHMFRVLLWLLIPAMLFAQNPNVEDSSADLPIQSSAGPLSMSFKNRPSLRIGEFANVDVKAKWHFDFRGFSPPIFNPPGLVTSLPSSPETFLLTKARVGLKGKVTKYVDYEVERDLRRTLGEDHEYHPWKDNYVNLNLRRWLQFKVGKFKMPFGMEETAAEDRLDYALKSNVSDTLTPSRERGAMLHGNLLKGNRLDYDAGVFRDDGENSGIHGIPTAGRTYAARLTGEPFRYFRVLPKTISHVYLGVAVTRGRMFEGLNGVKGQTFSGFTYLDHMYVRGNRMRIGTETAWAEGPFSIKAEYIHMSEERKQQGIRGEDLPDKISRGWYVTGAWDVLGKMKASGKAPRNPLLSGHGFGAVELSARYDVLTFYSAPGPGLPSRSPRAPAILPNSERTWTVGPTWYLNRFIKIQINGQRQRLTDIERKAVLGKNLFSTGIIRLQIAI